MIRGCPQADSLQPDNPELVRCQDKREGKARIPIPQRFRGANTYVKVFFKDAGHAQKIRLLPAPKEELRLG